MENCAAGHVHSQGLLPPHPNVPRVKKKYRIAVSICEAFPI